MRKRLAGWLLVLSRRLAPTPGDCFRPLLRAEACPICDPVCDGLDRLMRNAIDAGGRVHYIEAVGAWFIANMLVEAQMDGLMRFFIDNLRNHGVVVQTGVMSEPPNGGARAH